MKAETETIWKNFSKQLKSYISSRISDSELVDDILQEVFLKIHAKVDSLKDNTKVRGWVYRIARNTIIDHYRKPGSETLDMDTFPADADPERESAHREITDGLKEMVAALPEKYAQALLLVEFHGISQNELAQKLKLTISAAKSRVQRARRLLRDSLMRCCHFQFDRFGHIVDFHPRTCCCCSEN